MLDGRIAEKNDSAKRTVLPNFTCLARWESSVEAVAGTFPLYSKSFSYDSWREYHMKCSGRSILIVSAGVHVPPNQCQTKHMKSKTCRGTVVDSKCLRNFCCGSTSLKCPLSRVKRPSLSGFARNVDWWTEVVLPIWHVSAGVLLIQFSGLLVIGCILVFVGSFRLFSVVTGCMLVFFDGWMLAVGVCVRPIHFTQMDLSMILLRLLRW